MAEDNQPLNESSVVLTDDLGRFLPCTVEQTFDLQQQEYLLLLPIDTPIEIFAWRVEDDSDDDVLVDVEDDELDELFPTARAVLAEQNLTLQRTAITLTAAGELPESDDDDNLTLELDELNEAGEAAVEEFQTLATFYNNEEEFTICTPLSPLLIFARRNSDGDLEVVTPEEFQAIRSLLEEKLFDLLD